METGDYIDYPLPSNVKEKIKEVDISEVLDDEKNIERAKDRILRSVNSGYTGFSFTGGYDSRSISYHPDEKVELYSMPVARILISILDDRRVIKIYCSAESRTIVERVLEKDNLSLITLVKEMGIDISEKKESEIINDSFLCKVLENNYTDKNCSKKFQDIVNDRKGSEKVYYEIDFKELTRYSKNISDLKLPKNNLNEGKAYLSENQLQEYTIESLKQILQEDLPYDTSEVEDKIEDKHITHLMDKVNKFSETYSSDLEEDKIIKALDYLDPDCDYSRWRNIGFALADYYEDKEKAKEVYRSWSEKGSKYDEKTPKYIDKIIEKADPNSEENITIGTLIYYAKRNGLSFKEDNSDNSKNSD